MRLAKMRIRNFRSFGVEQEIEFDSTTLLIGRNSTGKTALMAALGKLFSPDPQHRMLRRSDFHLESDEDPSTVSQKDMTIEVLFEFDDQSVEDRGPAATFFSGVTVVQETGKPPILRVRFDATWEASANPGGSIDSQIRFVRCPEDKEPEEADFVRARRSELDAIRLIYVPAVRRPEEQLSSASSGLLKRILSTYQWEAAEKEDLQKKVQEINEKFLALHGMASLSDNVKTVWENYGSDARYNKATLGFYAPDIDEALKKPGITFEPSVTTRPFGADEIGDGLRSLLYFSLIHSMLKVEALIREQRLRGEDPSFNHLPPVFTLVAVEEPENHIAPQLLGKLVTSLCSMSDEDQCQVVITSHSSAIVKRITPTCIRHLSLDKDKLESICRPITLPESNEVAYKYVSGAVQAYPELYFADLVILGEGESEEIILRRLLAANGLDPDSFNISIVPLGGRHVNYFWRLLSDLEIPFITLLDLDWGRYGGGWGRIAYAIEQLEQQGTPLSVFTMPDGSALNEEELGGLKLESASEIESAQHLLEQLEQHDAYFSSPLDIDLAMLEAFQDEYKSIGAGPRLAGLGAVKDIERDDPTDPCYQQRIESAVAAVLQEGKEAGNSYSTSELALMVWYKYLFLDGSKPSNHFEALLSIDDDDLRDRAPKVLKRLVDSVKSKVA